MATRVSDRLVNGGKALGAGKTAERRREGRTGRRSTDNAQPAETAVKVDLAVLCEKARVNKAGRFCVTGIIDELEVKALPHTLATLTIAVKIDGHDLREVRLNLALRVPLGTRRSIDPAQASAQMPHLACGRQAFICELSNVPFDLEGEHVFEVRFGEELVARLPLKVWLLEAAPGTVH